MLMAIAIGSEKSINIGPYQVPAQALWSLYLYSQTADTGKTPYRSYNRDPYSGITGMRYYNLL